MSKAGQLKREKRDQYNSTQFNEVQHADNYNDPQYADNYNDQAQPENKKDQTEVEDNPKDESLRSKIINRQKAQSRMDKIKSKAMKKVDEKVFNPAKKGTGVLLKMAWEALIPSYGLSIIYLDLHVFLRFVVGSMF